MTTTYNIVLARAGFSSNTPTKFDIVLSPVPLEFWSMLWL
jgi:hypothetical protein